MKRKNETAEVKTGPAGAVPDAGTEEERTPEEKAIGKRRKTALIFICCILAALAVILPLTLIDFDKAGNKLLGIGADTITYCPPDYETDIWQNEEYLEQYALMTVELNDGTGGVWTYRFHDAESAGEAFAEVGKGANGASVLADYLSFLLRGASREDASDFAALFSENFKESLPVRFPQQKLCGIRLVYEGEEEDGAYRKWLVDFDVLNNDGVVVDWFDKRDSGQAHFVLSENGDGFVIERIIRIYRMN